MTDNVLLELPTPPRSKGGADFDNRHPEDVKLCLINGQQIYGKLLHFSIDLGALTISVKDGHHATGEHHPSAKEAAHSTATEYRMTDIKNLRLLESRQFTPAGNFLVGMEAQTELPDRQEYELDYIDGTKEIGETFGFITDQNGLHLFIAQPFSKYLHSFIPLQALQDYRIGPQLGQMLVDTDALSQFNLEQGLQKQENLRQKKIGEYLTANAIVSVEHLQAALSRQGISPVMKLGEALLQDKIITQEQLEQALVAQKKDRTQPLGAILIDLGFVTDEVIKRTLAAKLGIPVVDLPKFTIAPEVIDKVPEHIVRKHNVLPLCIYNSKLVVATDDPIHRGPIEDLRFHTKMFIEPVMARSEDIATAINTYYGSRIGMLAEALDAGEGNDSLDISEIDDSDNTLVRLVNKMIIDAYEQGASDIHVEPYPGKQRTIIRFRKDGDLQSYVDVPNSYRNALISRIKIMCNLDISERRKPQDGKINFRKFGPLDLELRVATIPTAGGLEDIVLRLLSSGEPLPMDKLGLSENNSNGIKKIIAKPYGLFLVCGPTGSGKTTTLHSILGELNRPDLKIWTAEDPIEITQRGLRQVQINNKIDVTFANAMRAFLRADPDIIMVGEMRDEETARIGIEASLTGHLVFSTLHTNSAPESIVRLLDMGLDPFNFADALLGVLAQRLAKRLCPKCKVSHAASDALLQEYAEEYLLETQGTTPQQHAELVAGWKKTFANAQGEITLYRPAGCDECGNTGYKGRFGVHELLVGSETVKDLIHQRAKVSQVFDVAMREGMRTLKQDGIVKMLKGTTDIGQIRAVCIR
ncbi:MAG: ATPase, T2SS/T4P/T4SS family [Pseudomonadota bacterium]